jgi:hypothetical protein
MARRWQAGLRMAEAESCTVRRRLFLARLPLQATTQEQREFLGIQGRIQQA